MKNNIKKILLLLSVVLLTALGAYAFSFRNMTLDFIHISDTHISADRDNTSYKALAHSSALLADAIEQINEIKGLDFVLFSGDMVDSATYDNYREYYTLLTKLKYPTLNAFGNHDLLYGTLDKNEVLEIVKKCNPNYRFDNTYYAFSPKTDFRIIILDSNPAKDSGTANGILSDEQLQFLDTELAQNQDKIVVISMHHPSVEPFVSSEHALKNANEFNEILIKYQNPIVVLTGHYHAAKIRRIGNIVYVSTPSMVTYPMAFRHIKIVNFKDRVNFSFDYIQTRLDDVLEMNRRTVVSYSTLDGLETDRNISYIYKKTHHRSVGYKRNKIKETMKTTKTSKREIKKLSTPNAKNKKLQAKQRAELDKEYPETVTEKKSFKDKLEDKLKAKKKKQEANE